MSASPPAFQGPALQSPAPQNPAPQNPVPKSPARGGVLDVLRFAAALFIVVFHFGDEAPVALRSVHDVFERGYLATDFFLMLSGFVLARAYGRPIIEDALPAGRFWLKRFIRIYPTHLITLTGLVVLVALSQAVGVTISNPDRFDWSALPAQVFLLHAFGLGGGQWNIPIWTLSGLLICYALFPSMWRALKRVTRTAEALSVGLIVLLGADLLCLALLGQEVFSLPFQWAFLRILPLFVLGLCLARAVETLPADSAPRLKAAGLAASAAGLANMALEGPDMISILAIAAVIMSLGGAPVARVLPGAAWGGRISFSLFMTHTLSGAVWFGLLGRLQLHPALSWVGWAGAVAFALTIAAAYDRLVDTPVQRLLNRGPRSRPPNTVAAVSARPDPRPAPEPSA